MNYARAKRSGALLSLILLSGVRTLRGETPPAPLFSPPAERATAAESAMVTAVRIVTEDGRVLKDSPENIAVVRGKPLDREAVRKSIHTLFDTGDYADIRVVRTSAPGGVQVDFVVRMNLFFNLITLEGLVPPPTESAAAAAMQIALGQVFRKETLDEGVARLQDALRDEGLYEAQLDVRAIPHADTLQMDIHVKVTPGPRARISEIHLTNHTGYPDAILLSRSQLRAGQAVTGKRLQNTSERIRKFLTKKGHLAVRALLRRGEYDSSKKTVPIELEVTEGPRVRVVLAGAKLSSGTLHKLIPVYQEGAVDTDLLEEGRRNLQERFERDGYFDADVTYNAVTRRIPKNEKNWEGEEEVITYTVDLGGPHKLVGIEITGNHYFSKELLHSRLSLITAAFASRGRFSRRLLDADTDSMRAMYLANGFASARVQSLVFDDYEGSTGSVLVRFVIQEGDQTRVASLVLEGTHAFSQQDLMSVIGSTPGEPYSEANVAADRDNILALYFNQGYPDARFEASVEDTNAGAAGSVEKTNGAAGSGPNLVKLTYHIEEGRQVRVRRILYSGQKRVRLGVVRREVRIRENEPLRQGEVVESQRRLYNLGIFNRVTVEPQNPSGTDPDKNVVVQVEEAKRYTIAYGGGIEAQRLPSNSNPTATEFQASPRGILEISKADLTGRADSLSLKLRGSTLQGRALLSYSEPRTFGSEDFSFQAAALAEKTRDISTFGETRYEGSVQLTQTPQSARLNTFLYRYSFRKVDISNLQIPADEVPLFNQPTLVSEFGVTWFRDSRNNPADATAGVFTSADFSVADTKIGSSASFLRFFLQNSTYHRIGRRFVFARSARFGVLRPYRDTTSLTFPAPTAPPFPTVIPLPERFFAGGGTSLRGFGLNQAGPRDAVTGFPVGGQAEIIFNQEFRFPMRVPHFGTPLGGALFYDAGNVYSRLDRVNLAWSPPRPVFNPANPTQCQFNCTNELNYFSHTVGFGVRYATPVGPIRVDIGYQLNRATFVIPCTNGAPNCQQGAQLPRLQFFFNLGAPF
ncbi:MAG TPA: POTRA domain-containing protein [Methylomirabilota bacterium]|nr:POTRA domain-containing protein [Methylomirabilota bacterium]